ncbi:MAG: tRNA 2-selenouridine(34) synthase MnmH [Cyclonatronaceae bacterium]
MRTLSPTKLLQEQQAHGLPLLDTRSPSEFAAGHIPGAISFPLFNDEERARVGTIYKQEGRKAATKAGLDFIGPKMRYFTEQAETLESPRLLMHCWRGGMRSQSLAWLLDLYGFEVQTLEGGYKAYRNALLEYFSKPLPLRVLSGPTGSMKTFILQEMRRQGAQVVDLEGLARHMGSSFGNLMCSGQPTTEQFQNDVFDAFLALDPQKPIWLEDESFNIGKVNFPEPLFHQKQQAPVLRLQLPRQRRIQVLVDQYGRLSAEELIRATEGIARRLGGANTTQAITLIQAGRLSEAADIILGYYDAAYENARNKKEGNIPQVRKDLIFTNEPVAEIAAHILKSGF